MPEPQLTVRVSRTDGVATVRLAGELDLATAGGLRTRLMTVVRADPPPTRVVVHLGSLDFVDASGLSVLLAAQRELRRQGGALALHEPSRMVRRVIALLDLDGALPVER